MGHISLIYLSNDDVICIDVNFTHYEIKQREPFQRLPLSRLIYYSYMCRIPSLDTGKPYMCRIPSLYTGKPYMCRIPSLDTDKPFMCRIPGTGYRQALHVQDTVTILTSFIKFAWHDSFFIAKLEFIKK